MIDLRAINKDRFSRAKSLWKLSNTLKIFIFVVGSISVLSPNPHPYTPLFLLAVATTSEIVQWRSDVIKSRSESLLRNLDLCRSFQREISGADKRDIVSDLPKRLRKQLAESEIPDTYFTNDQPPGPRKAIENLLESAWYTKKQTEIMAWVCVALIAIFLAVSIIALVVASRELQSVSAREGASKVATSWLLLIFSLGFIKNAWLYQKMALRCQKTESACEYLLRSDVTEADALKQWYEYQLARSSSPLLPEWLWRIKQSSLDDGWRSRGKQ